MYEKIWYLYTISMILWITVFTFNEDIYTLARHLDFIDSLDKPFIYIFTHKKNKEVGKLNSPNFLLTLNFTTNS